MISRKSLVDKLRELEYAFDCASKRAQTYKKSGSPKRVTFNTRDLYDDKDALAILRQAGFAPADAQAWAKEVAVERQQSMQSTKSD